jgi:hypothetical protein
MRPAAALESARGARAPAFIELTKPRVLAISPTRFAAP